MKRNWLGERGHIWWRYLAAGIAALFVLLTIVARAQNGAGRSDKEKAEYRAAMETSDQKIAAEVHAHSELVKNLEYLTTHIGARLTGSPQMNQASQWTLERFRAYGIDAHLETTEIASAWTRGSDSAEITSPIQRPIEIRSAGWSKATAGTVSGPVVSVDLGNAEAIEARKDKLKGAIVLLKLSERPVTSGESEENAYDAVIPPPRGVPKGGAGEGRFGALTKTMKALTEAGVAAELLDSGKIDNLFNMGGFGGGGSYKPSDVPRAFLTHEDFALLQRLAKDGPVTMKVALNGTFSAGPAPVSITVAEIKGSELPDERVIVGGHLDSWDLGQGALDNGTGAMAVLEAARTLKALGWKPKRTLTFILFTGEEEGGTGSRLYVKNHAQELAKTDAVLVHDTGTGKVFSIALEELYETAPLMEEIYRPLREVFDLQPLSTRYFGSSDHVLFLREGVPAYFCVQRPAHYGEAHHSQADTFDKVVPEEINEGAALLAAWMWNVSEMPVALPHHAPARDEQRQGQ